MTMTMIRTFEQADQAVAKLISVLAKRFPGGFPGLDKIGYVPASDAERRAIVLGCQCAVTRLAGEVEDRTEGFLQAMDAYGIIDAEHLAAQPIMTESMRHDGAL